MAATVAILDWFRTTFEFYQVSSLLTILFRRSANQVWKMEAMAATFDFWSK